MSNTNKRKGSKQKGVYKVTSGYYKGKYCADVSSNGKRTRKYFDTQAQAKNEYYRLQIELVQQECVVTEDITFGDFFEKIYLPHVKKNRADGTYENYKLKYETHVKKHLGKMRLTDIKLKDCQNVIDNLKTKKKSCYEAVHSTMSGAFTYAISNGMISSSPTRHITYPTNAEEVAPENIRCLSVDEQKKFIEVARKHKHYEQYMVLLSTGLRISELVGLLWSACDLNPDNPTIAVVRQLCYKDKTKEWMWKPPKRNGQRVIPIDEETRQILLSVKEMSKDITITNDNKEFRDVVFKDKFGMPIRSSTYGEHLERLAIRYNIEHFTPHTLRHTFATRCVEDGVNIKALSKILGHKSVTFTYNRYVHAQENFLYDEMKKRSNYISTNKTA